MARPQGAKNRPKDGAIETVVQEIETTTHGKESLPFTGVARSMECVRWNGFPNFYIVTLWVESGHVVKKLYSEPYAMWEAIPRLEIMNQTSGLNLNSGYCPGLAWRD